MVQEQAEQESNGNVRKADVAWPPASSVVLLDLFFGSKYRGDRIPGNVGI
jgi:hypothetical protein